MWKILTGAAAGAALLATGANAAKLDLNTGEGAIAAMRKVQCSLRDAEPVVYHWAGRAYSRVPGEPDRHLFDLEGMNIRQCATVVDPKRGRGFRMVSRELMFYVDPKTGAVLRSWTNPWSGKTVDVIHVANDPVNMRATFPVGPDGQPYRFSGRIEGGRVFMPSEIPLFYSNPLAGEFQDYIGGQYHAMEIFDFVADEGDLTDGAKPRANPSVAWVRLASWLPWMQMGDRAGLMVFNATGQTVSGVDALPEAIRREIADSYPLWRSPPPLDDTRPNESSWTYFKKKLVEKQGTSKP